MYAGSLATHPDRSVRSLTPEPGAAHLLRFPSLFAEGRGLAFPCDPAGRVDVDGLSERARQNYLYARAMCGREFGTPRVLSAAANGAHGTGPGISTHRI